MANLVFQSGSTWRKLGFALYSDSLSYREVLENNPIWSVVKNPPIGTALNPGDNYTVDPTVGLSQQSPILSRSPSSSTLDYYPFTSQEDYAKSLSRYNKIALKQVGKNNGLTMDSEQALTGKE